MLNLILTIVILAVASCIVIGLPILRIIELTRENKKSLNFDFNEHKSNLLDMIEENNRKGYYTKEQYESLKGSLANMQLKNIFYGKNLK